MGDALLWSRIVVLHTRVEQELARVLHRRHGLGLSDYRALSRLAAEADGILRIQELAEAIGLDQSSTSRLVARLEREGLTARELCEWDRRGVYSVITQDGRDRYAAAVGTYEDVLSAALDRASTDDALSSAVAALRAGGGRP